MIVIPDSVQYLLLMAGCLLITLPLEFVLGARVYRRPLRLLQTILVIVIIFSVWDILAIQADLWNYSEQFTSGIMMPFGLPLEELVFFVIIPMCALLTYEAVGRVLAFFTARVRRGNSESQGIDNV